MATTQPRIYKDKDSEMLIASSTILGHAINNKTFLVSKRATWADPYFGDLKARIDKAFQDFLGVATRKTCEKLPNSFCHYNKQHYQNLLNLKFK